MTARSWVRSAGLLFALSALLLTAPPAVAQVAPGSPGAFEIVGIEHDPRGSISVSVRILGAPAVTLTDPVLVVDQIPQPLTPQQTVPRQRAAIVLAIDTSGSMAGAPIVAARQAARDLIGRLAPEDQVSLLAFATTPTILRPFSTDRTALLASVDSLQASGATALYGAIAQAAGQLSNAPAGTDRVLVLLSDGADDGGVSKVTREESLRLLAATTGVKAYAIGFGEATDRAYLQEVASRTSGAAWHFGDRQSDALLARFADIGGAIGATEVIRANVPVLATGDHTVALQGRINGAPVSTSRTLHVTNEGLLAPAVRPTTAGDAPITVDLNSAVTPRNLTLTARIDDVELPVDSVSGTIAIDPWAVTPGSHTLRVAALAGDAVAAEASLALEVPALAPRLEVRRDSRGGATARGRVQGDASAVVVALVGGREVARESDGVLAITGGEASGLVTFRLSGSDGGVLAEQSVQIAAPGPARFVPAVLGLALAVAAVVLLVRRRNRRKPEIEAAPKVQPPLRRKPVSPSGAAPEEPAAVAVIGPSGAEQLFRVSGRPLTIGASSACDIVIEGEGVRGVHGRLTPLPGGDVMLHSLHDNEPAFARSQENEWMLLRLGDEIAIGPYIVCLRP
ncbi:MAG: VWA domain-containing protein [Dehalococcoidia bacterium]|nr:MAG: VWA domain-containing protein [Dehalococcoidia bacterium]